jgi:protein-S-isoprenylcysteine O-methyltransferase Ste14
VEHGSTHGWSIRRPYRRTLDGMLKDVTIGCLQAVGFAWLLAAGYFAIRRTGSVWDRLRQFAVTLFPEPWLIVGVPVVLVVLRLTPHSWWTALEWRNPGLAVLGTVCVVVSAALMLWARWVLGAMWAGRPLVQEEHELCTAGPYRLVRHPIYTGIAGLALGGTLVVGFGQMVLVLPATLAFLAWRVRVEDRLMAATFGDRFRAYRSEVRALLPVPRS